MPAWSFLMTFYSKILDTFGLGASQGNSQNRSKRERKYPDRQELANADKFYSNGFLVETVYAEDAEVDLEQQQRQRGGGGGGGGGECVANDARALNKDIKEARCHPYGQPNRMTTVLMPTDDEDTIVIR